MPKHVVVAVLSALLLTSLGREARGKTPRVPAFPGAEGHGAMTRGGRGGRAIAVTNLADSGPGSLRAAVEAEGPRIVVFRVSGTITLESPLKISHPYITIAGQTAAGDGIVLRKHAVQIDADEVVIRYTRIRLGDESGDDADAVSCRYHKNIILDHVSASWSIDEPGHDTHVAVLKLDEPWPAMLIHEQSAEEAYLDVLRDAGATLPKRDAVDRRIVEETRRGEATYEGGGYKEAHPEIDASRPSGIIDSPEDVGGWAKLASSATPPDGDEDGMPDAWEEKFGLDPRAASEPMQDSDRDGYTNVEEYLNGTAPTQFVDYAAPENNRNTLK